MLRLETAIISHFHTPYIDTISAAYTLRAVRDHMCGFIISTE